MSRPDPEAARGDRALTRPALRPRFAQPPGHYLVTEGGVRLRLRLAAPDDGPLLAAFHSRLASEDPSLHRPSPQPRAPTAVPARRPRRGEHALAFDRDTGALVATMDIAIDPRSDDAEVAISVAARLKGRGIRRALLRHAAERAYFHGARTLHGLESRADRRPGPMDEPGFTFARVRGRPGLVRLEAVLG